MELKRILARDSRSANEKAIQLYGSDVLIISTQRVDQQTELIVAVDVGVGPMDAEGDGAAALSSGISPLQASHEKLSSSDFMPFAQVFEKANTPTVSAAPSVDAPVLAPQEPVALSVVDPESMVSEACAPAVSWATDPQLVQYEQQRSQEIVDLLRQEMAALRKEFALSRQMQSWQPASSQSPEIQKLTAAMVEVGIPTGLRALLTDSIHGLDTLEDAWPVMGRLLVDALKRPKMAVPTKGIHVLCGPTGSGKTSMLGRLAYAAAQSHGAEQQVMISFADQRPGAWSQIQLLAAQVGASCLRAADISVLETLLDELHGKTVWIDTPGIDFAIQAQALMQQKHDMALHAVLPVDATVTNVQKIVQKNDIRWSSLMLTKMDEAAYPWPLIQSLCDQSMPIACMADDHNISASPLVFDSQKLVTLAMGPLRALLSVPDATSVPIAPAKVPRKRRASQPTLETVKAPAVRARSRSVKTATTAKAA